MSDANFTKSPVVLETIDTSRTIIRHQFIPGTGYNYIELQISSEELLDESWVTVTQVNFTRKGWINLEKYLSQISPQSTITSDGSTAKYYELPEDATQLQHLISHKDMNGQMAEMFRTIYRYGEASHSDKLREAKKLKYYATAEIERLEKLS